jgi:hypothetical protein
MNLLGWSRVCTLCILALTLCGCRKQPILAIDDIDTLPEARGNCEQRRNSRYACVGDPVSARVNVFETPRSIIY